MSDLLINVITGPTASGKSALALARARADKTIEIVNADASLIYLGFDIGTAKPSVSEREEILHHLIDILEPNQSFSAADYSVRSRAAIRDITRRRKTPLVVGGTGLYIDALFDGLSVVETDQELLIQARKKYHDELGQIGFDAMLEKLATVDDILFAQISRERNPRRLQRAWEFFYATGTPLGFARQQKSDPFEYQPNYILLQPERALLHKKIIERVDLMLASDWLDEVKRLIGSGVTELMPAMNAIGYRALAEVIRGEKELSDAREEIIIATRQYAKRQTTWMKRYARTEHNHDLA